jgi:CheY-like chemotaxis protein
MPVAKTLLAVDDSTTMRKVLEITFSGEDFRVTSAESGQAAMGKLAENPSVVVVDTVLGGEDGYAVAKEIRRRAPGAAIVMLASRYNPYDQNRGRDAGADDWADKPFDTQQLIDKVRKVLVAKEAGGGQAAAASMPPQQAPAAAPYRAPAAHAPPPQPAPQAAAAPPLGRGTQPSLGGSQQRTGTLVFGEQAPGGPAQRPQPAPAQHHAPPAASHAPSHAQQQVSGAVNGHLAGKLGELGLSPQQADAVLALSREVVERVVWEVVPQLAETIIKEEIARLTKEG